MLSKQISELESEIDWMDKNLEAKNLPKNYLTIFVSINGKIVKVLFDDETLLELIKEKFMILNDYENSENTPIFCFHNRKINMPYKGFIDRSNKIMEVYGKGFGILKSELNGFVSSMGKGVPAHAAGLSTEKVGGNLIIAGRNGGKSTAIINLINLCRNDMDKVLLSDDWILVDGDKMTGIDTIISLEPDNVRDNDYIDWMSKYNGIDRKTSIKLYPNGFEGYEFGDGSIVLNRVIILTQGMTKLITDVNNLDEVAQFIIKSAYHFPYNKELAEKHRAYWINILKDKQIIAYDRTYASSKVNGFLELIEVMK